MRKIFARTFIFILTFLCSIDILVAQVELKVLNSAAHEDFNSLVLTGTAEISTLPTGWVSLESGSNANTTYAAGTGSSNSGNTYSFGSDADRALGGLRSGSLIPTIGAGFINNTGAVITSLQITYSGEQWRSGATPRTTADRLDFQFSTEATSLATGAWTDIDALDFVAPVLTGTVGAVDGNNSNAIRTYLIDGISIGQGTTFWIRWNDFDVSGADDGLAIDDFSITPKGVPGDQPNLIFTPGALNFGEVSIGETKTLSYFFDAANLDSDSTMVASNNPVVTLSKDNVSFSDSLFATDRTEISVRFSPTDDGDYFDILIHTNGGFLKKLEIHGNGYEAAAHIIPVSVARSMAVGTRVTVTGRVTVGKEQGSPSYLQDNTGGIPVFDVTLSNSIEIGDSIIVTGPIGTFNDQVQISGSGISFFKADSSVRIISPKPIQLGDLDDNEGLLVTIQNVGLVNKSFVFYPQSTEKITNGTIQADLRIDGDTDLPGLAKPAGLTNITGVVGRFQSNAQFLPRFRSDIPGVSEPQTPTDSIPVTTTFDLMNWNLEFFGAQREDYPQEYGPANEPLQRDNAAKVVLAAKPDLLAVQEVSNPVFFEQLMNKLPGYASVCSDRYSHSFDGDDSFPPQKLCFIYDTTSVKVISVRPMFEKTFDDARTTSPELLAGIPGSDASSFWSSGRLPFMLTADVTVNDVTERILFINIHAKSGAATDDMNRRQYDMQTLKDSLDAHFANKKFVILGDINDDLDQSITTGQPSPYKTIVDDSTDYRPITLKLSQEGARSTISFDDVIDHQILSNEFETDYLDGSVRIFLPFSLVPNYATTTSDHLPVLSRYRFKPIESDVPTISFEKTAETFQEGSGVHSIRLLLSTPSTAKETVTISSSNSRGLYYGQLLDYTTNPAPRSGNIRIDIPAGDTEIEFTFAPNHDLFDEDEETASFNITLASGDLRIGKQSATSIHIEDVEPCLPIFTVYPNPTHRQVTILTLPSNENNIINGILIDPNGQQLTALDGTIAELSNAFTAALDGKRPGIYFVKLKACDKIITLRIVKW